MASAATAFKTLWRPASAILMRAWGAPVNLLVARGDGFALGAWLAVSIQNVALIRRMRGLAVLGGVSACLASASVTGSTLMAFAIVASVVLTTGERITSGLRLRPIVYLGTISYGLYLYHYPILLRGYSITIRLGVDRLWIAPWLIAALSVAVASGSWYLIERPILRLKDRLAYASPRPRPYGVTIG